MPADKAAIKVIRDMVEALYESGCTFGFCPGPKLRIVPGATCAPHFAYACGASYLKRMESHGNAKIAQGKRTTKASVGSKVTATRSSRGTAGSGGGSSRVGARRTARQ